MLARVVTQQCLLVLPREVAVRRRASVRPAVWEYLVNLFFEMLHDEMVLLLSVFIFGLWLEAAELAGVSGPDAVQILGQGRAAATAQVQHF